MEALTDGAWARSGGWRTRRSPLLGVWTRSCRWEPQGGPCALSPHGASLRHVNENKYGDCDIRSP